jgi:hypothetical protein|tara:strand:- start:251 stop:640 length:390 start_codon:yes stop_codon:yes gene_type:complete
MADKKYITFIDSVGRAIFGVNTSENDESITVQNPVMITVQQQEQGQMAVQLFPLFFQEFVVPDEDGKRYNNFDFKKATMAVASDLNIEPRIIEQYERIVNPQLAPAATQDNNAVNSGGDKEVINLFDDE